MRCRSPARKAPAASARCLLQARPRAASRRWRIALAERLGGVVVNANSMQVYRDLRIITARPTPDDEARVPHRLYGHVDAAENYSVGRWCADAKAVLDETPARRPPADPGRRHRALLQGADARAVGGAADAAGHPRRSAGAVRRRGGGGAACRAHSPRSGHRRPSQARRPDAHRPRARSAGSDRTFAHRLAPRRHAGDARSRQCREAVSRRRPRRTAAAGSMRASTPCWRTAPWTR